MKPHTEKRLLYFFTVILAAALIFTCEKVNECDKVIAYLNEKLRLSDEALLKEMLDYPHFQTNFVSGQLYTNSGLQWMKLHTQWERR